MVEEYQLSATVRNEKKAKKLRLSGQVPAVVYGSDFDNVSISLNKLEFDKVFEKAGESSLINLKIDDKQPVKVLVHDIQKDPITMNIIHIDFYKVNMKEKIRTEIPLQVVGESPAVSELEGTMVMNKDSVEVECLPSDLVSEIQVDVSNLKTFDDLIKVADIKAPAGIEILDDPEEVAILVQPPRSDEELAQLEEEVTEDVESVKVEGEEEKAAESEEAEVSEGGQAAEGKSD